MSVNRRGVVAAALSVVYPGVGHLYLRAWLRAIGWVALSLVTSYVLVPDATLAAYEQAIVAGNFGALGSVAVPLEAAVGVLVVRLCNVVDAYVLAVREATPSQTRDGEPACPACGRSLDTELDFCPWCTTEIEWHYPSESGRDAN
ncbi:zinc ribbon domain-containing protein [Halarchaeum grantii]|uniref:Zinc ribbon domain-containing protein n=1 Tax=Halarchaeum grantii TaxID=1193105 RepID=A0A830FC55_9EURY|nr:zinc ribbon domain-containing protein [Halarchaeum grantii]GGL32279.1 zinc ribbon domain-containing protein [Halarchaeum grantii]